VAIAATPFTACCFPWLALPAVSIHCTNGCNVVVWWLHCLGVSSTKTLGQDFQGENIRHSQYSLMLQRDNKTVQYSALSYNGVKLQCDRSNALICVRQHSKLTKFVCLKWVEASAGASVICYDIGSLRTSTSPIKLLYMQSSSPAQGRQLDPRYKYNVALHS
jgi:hypothetical protein